MAFDGLPVAARDRAGELESVLDHAAHQRIERLRRDVGRLEQRAGGAAQGDEVVRGDRRAGVVRRAVRVIEREWLQSEGLREPEAQRLAPRPSPRVTAAQAPSSCSGPRDLENDWSGCMPKRRSCGSSAASGVAPLTCATHGPGLDRRARPRRSRGRGRRGGRAPARRRRSAMPRSASRALTAEPTRPPAPMTLIRSIIGRAPVPSPDTGHARG